MEAGFAVAGIQIVAVLAAIWLSGRRRLLNDGLPYLVSLAVGVLLATALLHIMPEAVATLGNRESLWIAFCATIFTLFCVERISHAVTGQAIDPLGQGKAEGRARHVHSGSRPIGLVFGGMLHSFVDGVSVAAAFTAGRRVGWVTAAAITLHEVPHRMGDFALLIHLRVSRRRAMQWIAMISFAAVAGVVLVEVAGHAFVNAAWLLPVSAASFIYIALVNLMPELAGDQPLSGVAVQMLLMLCGAVAVGLLLQLPVV